MQPAKKRKTNVQAALKAAVKQSSKPGAKAAKLAPVAGPAKPAVPAVNTERAERQALTDASRAIVSAIYATDSLPVHGKRPPKLADCLARIKTPIQSAIRNGASARDESLLYLLNKNADKAGAFDPTAANICADLGVLSRLASLGFVAVQNDTCIVTPTGAERARVVAKRA